MGDIYRKAGYFHVESLLNPPLAAWTKEEAADYAGMRFRKRGSIDTLVAPPVGIVAVRRE
ncbi:MAG: hypothetical protein ACOCVJ_01140 [Verrucomicrobiota bacterium]